MTVHPHKVLKELRSNTPSRCPAGHAQEPSRPHAPGRNSLSRSPKVTGRDLLPPKPRTLKPRGKLAGSTTRPGTGPLSAGSTSDNSHKNSGKGPRNSASAGTAPNPPSRTRHAAPHALRPTGSPAGRATPTEGPRPKKSQRPARQTNERGTGYNPSHDDHQQPGRFPRGTQEQSPMAGRRPGPDTGRRPDGTTGQVRRLCGGAESA